MSKKTRDLKKMRKYARKEAQKTYGNFVETFKVDDIIKDCPRFFPGFLWNMIVNFVIKK